MNTKVAIMGEMAFLYCSTLVIYRQKHRDKTVPQILVTTGIRSGVAVALVATGLLVADDLGAGELAAGFGLLIVGSALLSMGTQFATAFDSLISSILEPA